MPRNVEQIEMPAELFSRTALDQRKGLDWVAGNLAAIERLALVVDDVLVFDLRVDRGRRCVESRCGIDLCPSRDALM